MRNLVQDGLVVNVTAPDDVQPGELIAVGSLLGVTVTGAATGQTVAIRTEGVFKNLGGTGTAGTPLFFDTTASTITTTKAGNLPAGVSLGDGLVRLNGTV